MEDTLSMLYDREDEEEEKNDGSICSCFDEKKQSSGKGLKTGSESLGIDEDFISPLVLELEKDEEAGDEVMT